MSATRLNVVGEVVSPEAVEWDRQVTEVIRDFVQLGELLMKGRDGQLYRELGFDTWEDWCKSKQGLSISRSQQVIKESLIYKAISGHLGHEISCPETAEHVRQIGAMASVNVEKRKVQKQDGSDTYVEQPVGIKNPQALADQWTKTVNEFERLKAKAEKEGSKPPTFSGKFVRNQLPNRFKVTPDRGFNCNPLVRLAARMDKLHEDIKQQGFTDKRKVPVLIEAEPPCLSAQVGDLKNQLELVADDINKMLEILEDYE